MDHDTVWRHIHDERACIARMLAGLTVQQWEVPSLCSGWSVRDVAAHVISTPQLTTRELVRVLADSARYGYNGAILRDVQARGRQPRERILEDYARYATSTRHVATTTSIEPLLDVLVHHQDMARPLGIDHQPERRAAVVAAGRARLLAPLLGSRRVVRGVRMVATDTDWVRGSGPSVAAPMVELLMLCAGREADPSRLPGDAVDALRSVA